MGNNRKTFTDTFEKEVAPEVLKEQKTVNEIAAKYGVSNGRRAIRSLIVR